MPSPSTAYYRSKRRNVGSTPRKTITGPPGISKTTSAHLYAKLAGFTPIEVNASDSRSKKLVEVQNFILFAVVGVLIN